MTGGVAGAGKKRLDGDSAWAKAGAVRALGHFLCPVIPAKAGIQPGAPFRAPGGFDVWIPAFAGMTH
jgi:hypothetical protein